MKERNIIAEQVVNLMYENDAYSRWMEMERIEVKPGSCTLRMVVRKEMTNGFLIAHGGITYALADSALAFASNSHGRKAVSIETSISHLVPVKVEDELTAVAEEEHLGNKIGVYKVIVTNQEGQTVALFKGTVYRTSRLWEVEGLA